MYIFWRMWSWFYKLIFCLVQLPAGGGNWTTGCTLPWFRIPPLQDYHWEWDMYGAWARSTKFRGIPYDIFSRSFSVDTLAALQLRFSVSKHFWHCLSHTYFTSPPPSCFIWHHRPLLSLLQFAVLKHFWHCPTYELLTVSAAHVVPLFSSHLSDCHHASHCPSDLNRVLRQTAQVLDTILLCSLVCSSQPLIVTFSTGLAELLAGARSLRHAACTWFKTNEKTYPRSVQLKITNNWVILGTCPRTRLWHTIQGRIINILHFILILNFAFSVNVSIFLTLQHSLHSQKKSKSVTKVNFTW